MAGEHFIQHAAERPDVGPGVDVGSGSLLGGHVGASAQGRAFASELGVGRRQLRQSEVEDDAPAAVGNEKVGGLDVAVDDALRVRVGQTVGELGREPERPFNFDRSFRNLSRKLLAFEVGHRQERPPGAIADFVYRADIGMIQRRGGASLPQEALADILV